MRSLMWFRADLRVCDNTALHAAAAAGQVVGLFVISPEEWASHDFAPVRVDFMLRTLAELSAVLDRLGIPLLIERVDRARDVPGRVLAAAKEHRCEALHFNREYELDESRRDAATVTLFERAGLKAHAHDDQAILPPGNVLSQQGQPMKVFTPFRRRWIERYAEQGGARVLTGPRRQESPDIKASPIPESVPGFDPGIDPCIWPAGEAQAMRRLRIFAQERIQGYKETRDRPDLDGTSALSPYLAIGAISPRQCLAAAIEANPVSRRQNPVCEGDESVTTWISELIWREFYIHITAAFPNLCMGRAFKPETERIRWSTDEEAFERWTQGRTGFPIVDAGMRQLKAIGWMHNRVRMITAMFLVKDLLIDWRWGERHFMRHLVDGFFASNNGGWQWSASTGTDAAPFFRIFNPTSQGKACDPDGTYIRRYCPELAHLDPDDIHEPHAAGLAAANLRYPEPMIDHRFARERTLAAYRAAAQA